MNPQSPPRHIATTQVAPGTQAPVVHPPIWHSGPDLPIIGSTGSGILGFCFALLMLLPAFGLAILLLLGLGAMQDVPSSDESSFTTSSLILFLLGFVVLMGLVFGWFFSAPSVQAFTFDEGQQLLTLTVTRRGRKPSELRVPFSDILYICPYQLAMFDRDGHFSVVYKGPKNKVFEYRFAEGTSLEEIEFHSAWLRGIIGERMHELLNLDK
ncbi:hypothetical protein [Pseudomonas sp. 52 E 6]|uniref:hypothetical protein n=1 Tax=Pseudomonas sp. 52 E 6 TaxID=1844106 RepID=UPI00081267D9|nr:hypothetical protein [Pseudomonas sp. 52 E 6]CRM08490.1 hypothetical protein [Pseudomonas sp. 52 E 6]